MSFIHVLDDNTINKIAAGEVVERPASVIKELVENAIDAKADRIEVEITAGGTSFMRVTDNGIGMSREDAAKAMLRHATSKIKQVSDLQSIDTLGFRGEALPSIASVSRFSLQTRQAGEELGTEIKITGGKTEESGEVGCGLGTTIRVEDLFFNTPARKKFLKTNNTEAGKINEFIIKLAISKPHIAFQLINNNKLAVATPGKGDLKETLQSIYGGTLGEALLPLSFEDEDITIEGFVSKPSTIRSSRSWQTFIVNGRIIGSRAIAKAVDNAYHALIPKTGYPLVVLNLTVPQDTIDVNVHPQKSELKFEDDSRIFKAVYKAVLDAVRPKEEQGRKLGQMAAEVEDAGRHANAGIPEMRVRQGWQGSQAFQPSGQAFSGSPIAQGNTVHEAQVVQGKLDWGTMVDMAASGQAGSGTVNGTVSGQADGRLWSADKGRQVSEIGGQLPVDGNRQIGQWPAEGNNHSENMSLGRDGRMAPVTNAGLTGDGRMAPVIGAGLSGDGHMSLVSGAGLSGDAAGMQQSPQAFSQETDAVPEDRLLPMGQVDNTYIVARNREGLYIVDQHAAHERVLFDRFSRRAEAIPVQQLLVHVQLEFGLHESQVLEENLEMLGELGFGLEPSGPRQFRLTEVPADVPGAEAEDFIREILASLEELHKPSAAELRQAAIATTACKAAIKAGCKLDFRQMEILLEQLRTTDMPYTCPHGRPTILKFSNLELAKMFKRTGF